MYTQLTNATTQILIILSNTFSTPKLVGKGRTLNLGLLFILQIRMFAVKKDDIRSTSLRL